MPILARESDIYPDDLLDRDFTAIPQDQCWWAIYTRSRREKELIRRLQQLQVAHYCPIAPHRAKSPAGRIRTSHKPLFSNYVFLFGDESARYAAMTTSCISQYVKVDDGVRLARELAQIRRVIETGAPLTIESKLAPGTDVRVRTGAFQGFEGRILRREGQTRLLVYVNFLQQGASILLEDCEVEES